MKLKMIMINFDKQFLKKKNHHLQKHPLINQINKWEEDSIEKIKQTAEESRQKLINYIRIIILLIWKIN